MRQIFFLVLLFITTGLFAQAPANYTNINGRYRWIAGMFDSTFHIPKGTTTSLRTGGSTNAGALFYRTTDSSVYYYTGTQWLKVAGAAGFVPYTGATQNVDLGQFGLKTKYVEFDTSSQAVTDRRLQWSNAEGTLQFGMTNGSTITQRIGLEQFARVRNLQGDTIEAGDVVYISGASGDRAAVKLADNRADSTSSKTLGVATEQILPNDVGLVGTFGVVGKLNLSAFTAGDVVYLDSIPGKLTKVKPQAPYHMVFVGVVERANAGNGLLFVNVQNGYELEELHNVRITSPVRNNAILAYDSVGRLWKDTTLNAIGGITGSGTSGQVSYFDGTNSITGSNNLFWDNANSRLGVGGSPGAFTLDVNGTARVQGNTTILGGSLTVNASSAAISIQNAASGNKSWSLITSGNNLQVREDGIGFPMQFNAGGNVLANQTSGTFTIGSATASAAKLEVTGSITAASAIARGVNLTNTLVAAANNDVLVGLDINPTFTNGAFTGVTNLGLRVQNDVSFTKASGNISFNVNSVAASTTFVNIQNGTSGLLLYSRGSGSTGAMGLPANAAEIVAFSKSALGIILHSTAYLALGTNTTEQMRLVASTGNLLLNTTTDGGFRLDVNGTARIGNSTFALENSTSASQPRIDFVVSGAYIGQISSSGTDAIYRNNANGGNLRFETNGGTVTERMRITSAGNVLINTTSSNGSRFQVNGNAYFGTASTSNINVFLGTNIAGLEINGGTGSSTASQSAYLRLGDVTNTRYIMQQIDNNYNLDYWFFNGGSWSNTFSILTNGSIESSGSINLSGSSLTGSNAQSLVSLSQTWNTTGNPTAFLLNITNTASGATADLMELQVGGVSQFTVGKSGTIQTTAPAGGTAKPWKLGNVAVVSPTSPDRTIEVEIDGVTYYIHAKTTNN